MSGLRLPRITIETLDEEDGEVGTILLETASLTSSGAPRTLAKVQMTMSLLFAYIDVLKHLSGIATEGAARDIRMEEKRTS